MVESLLIALQRVAPIAAINIVASAARMIVSIALLGRGLSVTALLWVIGVTQILTALALWRVARTTVRDQRLAWDGVIARNSARSALFFTGGGLASILFKRFDTLLVEGMLGAAALGIYSAAFRLYLIIQSASPPILRLLLPRFAQAHTQSSREVANQVRSTSATLSVVFGTLVIGLVSLSPIVLTAIFGSAYAQSVPAYLLLSMSTMPLVLNGVFTTAANAIHLEARTVQAGVVNGIAGVAMSYVCISLFGVAGAAAGVIFASALGLLQAAWILRSANALDARGALFVAAAGLTFPEPGLRGRVGGICVRRVHGRLYRDWRRMRDRLVAGPAVKRANARRECASPIEAVSFRLTGLISLLRHRMRPMLQSPRVGPIHNRQRPGFSAQAQRHSLVSPDRPGQRRGHAGERKHRAPPETPADAGIARPGKP